MKIPELRTVHSQRHKQQQQQKKKKKKKKKVYSVPVLHATQSANGKEIWSS